jgi:hypothetical protein
MSMVLRRVTNNGIVFIEIILPHSKLLKKSQ